MKELLLNKKSTILEFTESKISSKESVSSYSYIPNNQQKIAKASIQFQIKLLTPSVCQTGNIDDSCRLGFE